MSEHIIVNIENINKEYLLKLYNGYWESDLKDLNECCELLLNRLVDRAKLGCKSLMFNLDDYKTLYRSDEHFEYAKTFFENKGIQFKPYSNGYRLSF